MIRASVPARLGLLLVLLTPPVAGVADAVPGDSRQQQVDALFCAWNKAGSPGCVTGVMSQGRLVYARGYGRCADALS